MITSGVASASSFPGCNIRREVLLQKLHDFDEAFKGGEIPGEADELYCHGQHALNIRDPQSIYDFEGANKSFERELRNCPGDTLGEIVSNVEKKEIPWQLAENRWEHRELPAALGTWFGALGTLKGLTSFIEAPGLTGGIVAATSVAVLAGSIACFAMPTFINHQRKAAEHAAAMVKIWGALQQSTNGATP